MGRRTIMAEWSSGSLSGSCPGGHRFKSCLRNLAWKFNGENIMSGCHAPCDTDSNNSFFDGNEEMGVRFPPTQLIRISVLKPNMERWRNGRRGSYVQYVMFVALTAIYYSLGPASLMVQIHPSPFKAMAQMSLQIKKMRQLHE